MPMLYFKMQSACIGDVVQLDILNAGNISYISAFLFLGFAKIQYQIWPEPLSASAIHRRGGFALIRRIFEWRAVFSLTAL